MILRIGKILLALFLLSLYSFTETKAQGIDSVATTSYTSSRKLSLEIGITIGSHFVDRSYNYNYNNSNTQAGLGGFSIDLLFKHKFKFKLAGSNLDENPLGGHGGGAATNKNFSYMISGARYLHRKKYSLEYGISYLYFYERKEFVRVSGAPGIQFSSNDHYLGGYVRGQYLIGRRVGPYIDYYIIPFRLNNGNGFAYNHNISIGISFRIF